MTKKRRALVLSSLLSAIILTIQAAAMSATAPSHSPASPGDFDPDYAGFGEGGPI